MDLHVDLADLALLSVLIEQKPNPCFVARKILQDKVDERTIRARYNRLRDVLKYFREEDGSVYLTKRGRDYVDEINPILRAIQTYKP